MVETCSSCNRSWGDKIVHGAVGLAKNILHIEQVDDATRKSRLAQCASCDDLKRHHPALPKGADVSLLDACVNCGCIVREKVKLENERCPKEKW